MLVTLEQAWANCGPGAICGPLTFSIRPAELEIILNLVNVLLFLQFSRFTLDGAL